MSQELLSANQSYVLLSDLANELKIPAYRLRSWEVLYPFIKSFRDSSGRRFYDEQTVEIFREISRLLYQEGRKNTEIFTIISRRFSDKKEEKVESLEKNLNAEKVKEDLSSLLASGHQALPLKEGEMKSYRGNETLKKGLHNLLGSLNKLGETIVSHSKF